MDKDDYRKNEEATLDMKVKSSQYIDKATGIYVYLMGDVLKKIQLPIYPEGRYYFSDDKDENMIYIEAKQEKWNIYTNEAAYFLVNNKKYHKLSIQDRAITIVKNKDKVELFYCEYINKESLKYHNYFVKNTDIIKVGKSFQNNIIYHNNIISDNSFTLKKEGMNWRLLDSKDYLFVYVNGYKNKKQIFVPGDVITFLGLTMIIGYQFISISDGNAKVTVNDEAFYKLDSSDQFVSSKIQQDNKKENHFFNRLPRRRMPLLPKKINFEAPPMSLNDDKIPLLLRMGGSMVMSGRSMMMGNYTSLLSSVLFPILNSKYSDKQKQEYEERRKEKYTEYLKKKEQEIFLEKAEEEKVLKYNYPELRQVLDFSNSEIRLWERRKTDDDFLNIRIGHGDIPLIAEYEYQKERFMLDEDPLEAKMYDLVYKPVYLNDAPIMNSFIDNYVCGVSGKKELRFQFIEMLVLQIVMTHSYDEVKLFFLVNQDDLMHMEYIRYLPHVWNDEKTMRFIATNTIDSYQLSEYLKNEIGNELERGRDIKKILKDKPYYIVIALDKKIFDSMEVLKDVMQNDENVGVCVMSAFDDLPKDCSRIFQLHSSGKHSVIHIKELDKKDIHFQFDFYDRSKLHQTMKQISNKYLKIISETYSLPKMLTFLEMFNVGRIEHLNPVQRWQKSNPVKSLSTPVGVATDGTLMQLDLHQKYQGPHGLIAGMTGSGKSEFIITYILSLAINYHPDEVAFLLIDYKGGGLAGAFEDKERGIRLPHLVGTITNLDGSMIQRSLMSIQSELTKRQRIFNEVKQLTGEASIDIYSYQNLYRNKVVHEPLPHLFIIADEFAELKQQQPEFMDQLISAARIGRSLGVHLILATQKPSGVVNDQIRSNTKFRVCLKVQDKADSMDMLKRSEAAELKDTGRFYLQVGYNDYFALGQSAWAGAMYEPQDSVVQQKDDSIQFIDELGQTILENKKQVKSKNSEKTQLTAIVKYLSDVAQREGIQSRKLWMDPLPHCLDIKDIPFDVSQYQEVVVPVGLLDDPQQQKQFPLYLPLQSCKNLWIVGETKSGKTTLIQTILNALIQYYSSQEVNFYILDYSSRMLKMYKDLPHCGTVLDEEDSDKLNMFFDMMQKIIQDRKDIFKRLQVDSYEAAYQIEKIPMIFVIIDNISGLKLSKTGEKYFYELPEILKAGMSYGVKYIVSSHHINDVSARMRQELGSRMALRLKDKYDYGEVIECRCQYLPDVYPGRGIYNVGGTPLQYQGAMYFSHLENEARYRELKNMIDRIIIRDQDSYVALKLPEIDNNEEYVDFSHQFQLGRLPLGYLLKNAQPIALPWRQFSMLSLYFGNHIGTASVLENILYISTREKMSSYIVKAQKQSLFNGNRINKEYYQNAHMIECNIESLTTMYKELANRLLPRKQLYENYCLENGLDCNSKDTYLYTHSYMSSHCEPILIMFESFLDVCHSVDEAATIVFNSFFVLAKRYNIYLIGCFYPGDALKLQSHALYSKFNPQEMTLLFGGNYHEQGLIKQLPPEYSQIRKPGDYKKFVLKYRDCFYFMQMPCGQLKEEYIHEDDQSIFGGSNHG